MTITTSKTAKGRVLITGGAAGIGLCTAREFARAGYELVLTDINAAALEAAAKELRDAGARVEIRAMDVSDRAAVQNLARWVIDDLGGLDVLINNAGVGYSGELAETDHAQWERLLAINFWGPIHHIEAFLPHMRERGAGRIVNVSSGQAFFRLPTWGAYAAIKLALGAVSELLSYEVAKYGVGVTTVYPFMVNTGFYSDVKTETTMQKLSMKLVPWYSHKPETVARMIFRATTRGKRVEMVSVLNRVMLHVRALPLAPGAITRIATWLLAKSADGSASNGAAA